VAAAVEEVVVAARSSTTGLARAATARAKVEKMVEAFMMID
jgi:hypothetical protein